jgi:hypothetical protein
LVKKKKGGGIEYDYPAVGQKFSKDDIENLRRDHLDRLDAVSRPDHKKVIRDQFKDLTGESL